MKKIWITFSNSFKCLMDSNHNFTFLCSLFHIFMAKTNYDQLENFKRIGKQIEKSSVSPIAALIRSISIKTIIQFKRIKIGK